MAYASSEVAPYLLLGMAFHVHIEESPTNEVLVTQFTLVRSLSGVVAPVYHKSRLLCERLCAEVALIRTLPCMYTSMLLHIKWFTERFPTYVTYVRFLASVYSAVELKMILVRQGLATNITNVHIGTCVRVHMKQQ